MATATLTATPRPTSGKSAARSLRRDGRVPAVIYGHAREPLSLSVNARELDRLLERISAENTVIDVSLDGGSARTLIREIQRHPVKRQILHVDFQELVAGEKVTVNIPLVLVGIPEGVRTGGGVMDQTMRELEIEVDPGNIPNHIDVDVANLAMGHSLHVRDLVLPSGVTVLDDEELTIVVVAAPRAVIEAAAAPSEEAALAEPEVIGKAKSDEDEEEDTK